MKALSWRRYHYRPIVSVLLIMLIMVTLIVGMGGCGDRPASNAIEIRTWYDLDAVGNNLSANYTLMNDLHSNTPGYTELASPTADGGKGWLPIGIGDYPNFTGLFDGKGNEIRDLFINRPDEDRVGLFSQISMSAVIRNVGVVDATVTGDENVGGLLGFNYRSTVSNSYSSGSVTGNEDVGGLVGRNAYGSIVSDSYFTGSVSGGNFAGGLVGYIDEDGAVYNCWATGSVTGGGQVGGLVGLSYGAVTDSYSTGNVAGYGVVGGLLGLGYDASTVTNCYATGSVIGEWSWVGGLVGSTQGTVSDSYATGSVTGNESVGGLAGIAHNVSSCYATGDVTGTGDGAIGGLVGWHTDGTVSYSHATGSVTGDYSGGLVGVNGYNWLQFGQMALDDNDTVAIYYSYSTGSVTGSICVGGLVGENYLSSAVVGYSYSTGSATGNNMTGGLVGLNAGNVIESYAIGSVAGNDRTGGLVGYNWLGIVTDSYSRGSVAGNSLVGGLVGYSNGGTASNSFWDTQTSGQGSSAGGTGKTTAEMQDFITFSGATWDIAEVGGPSERNTGYIWNIVDDVTYPFLSWQP